MDDMSLNLVVIATTGLAIAGLFLYLSIRKRRKQADFEAAAEARGWRVQRIEEPLTSGYLLTGGSASAPWSLETRAIAASRSSESGSSDISHTTRWWSKAIALSGRAVVLGPALPGVSALSGGLDSPLARMALQAMLGVDAAWVTQLRPVALGERAAKLPLLCLANDPADAQRLLTPEVIQAFSALPVNLKPVLKLRSEGLEISLPTQQLDEAKDIAALVALGEACIRTWGAP